MVDLCCLSCAGRATSTEEMGSTWPGCHRQWWGLGFISRAHPKQFALLACGAALRKLQRQYLESGKKRVLEFLISVCHGQGKSDGYIQICTCQLRVKIHSDDITMANRKQNNPRLLQCRVWRVEGGKDGCFFFLGVVVRVRNGMRKRVVKTGLLKWIGEEKEIVSW